VERTAQLETVAQLQPQVDPAAPLVLPMEFLPLIFPHIIIYLVASHPSGTSKACTRKRWRHVYTAARAFCGVARLSSNPKFPRSAHSFCSARFQFSTPVSLPPYVSALPQPSADAIDAQVDNSHGVCCGRWRLRGGIERDGENLGGNSYKSYQQF
jgi:hypothetical protein